MLSWQGLRLCFELLVSRLRGGEHPAVLLRQALQRLGMTGLKLGQFLALRSDMFSPEVCQELSLLFESVAPMEFSVVRAAIEADLGEPLENLFSEFEPVFIAAASIAQVHRARTREGERVAVKVQRPGIEQKFNADMRILRRLAFVIDALGVLGALSLVAIADEFARFARRELDFVTEGETADRLRAAAVSGEIVPRIYWGLSGRRVLTMEFIEGVSMGRVATLLAAGNTAELHRLLPDLDLPLAMHNLMAASLHQLYAIGFFHADPHPGNILICPGNRIGFIDFGIFGEVSPIQKELLARYLEELVMGNLAECIRCYSKVYTPTERTDMAAFQLEASSVLRRWFETIQKPGASPEERLVANFSDKMLAVVRHHHLRISVETLLFWRAMIVLDASIVTLSPGTDLLSELRIFFAEHRPGVVDRALKFLVPDEAHLATLFELATQSAGKLDAIMSEVVAGRFEAKVSMKESAQARRRENRRVRSYVLALAGASILLLARTGAGGAFREAIGAAATACFILSLIYHWKK